MVTEVTQWWVVIFRPSSIPYLLDIWQTSPRSCQQSQLVLPLCFSRGERRFDSIMARIDPKSTQTWSAGTGHFRKPTCFVVDCMVMGASLSMGSASKTLPTYHFLSYTAATQSSATGLTAVFEHSMRRCTFQPHGDSGLYIPFLKHSLQWQEVSLAMIFPGEMAATAWTVIAPWTGVISPKRSIYDLAVWQASFDTKVKDTELADWCCCVQEKKSDASLMETFCCLTASSAIRLTDPPTPSQEPFPWPASK